MYRSFPQRLASFLQASAHAPSCSFLLRCASVLLTLAGVSLVAGAQGVQTFPGHTAVGNTATKIVTVSIATAGAAASPTAVTTGITGLDFSTIAGGTCTAGTSYTVGQQCTVNVQFAPLYPGQRNGAVLIEASDGTLLGSALIGGIASGALPVLVPGSIDTFAGSGSSAVPVDNVLATSSPIHLPQGLVIDAGGNLILSDYLNYRIRRVDAQTGMITTVVGNGIYGYAGDGGVATSANISAPSGLAMDGAGNLYFSDTNNHVVRRVDAISKIITTVAGVPQTAGFRDGGGGTPAELNLPQGLAFDAAGNLYIADSGNHALRRLNIVTGVTSTVAGTGIAGYNGDSQLATVAQLNGPQGVFVKVDGSILIADTYNNRIRSIDLLGNIQTIVGTGDQGIYGDTLLATMAKLNGPTSVAMDPVGNLYIADSSNNRIRFVNASTGVISTLAGNDSSSFSGDGSEADHASLYEPYSVVFSQSGDLYLSDELHNRVRLISGSKDKLTYAPIRVGKVSSPLMQDLANYGDQPLQLYTPVLFYAQFDPSSTTCSPTTVLAPSDTCAFGIDFAPTVTGNDVVGYVKVPSNASVAPVMPLNITVDGQVLNVNPTSVTLSSSGNPSVVGSQVTFTAIVISDDSGRTGNVTFTGDGATLCTVPLGSNGSATCAVSTLALGSHSIVAQYAGDPQNAAATSATLTQVVKQQATFTISSSANPSVVGNPVTFTAMASATTGTPSGIVTFLDGATSLGSVTMSSGSAILSVSTLAVGSHAIAVQYAGDTQNAPTTSGVFPQTVLQAGTTTMLATSNAIVPVGTAITLTATVAVATTNGPTPTGTVTFTEGATTYGTSTLLSNGTSTFTFASLLPGAHALTATYSGDINDSTSISAPMTQTVLQIGTTTTLSVDSNPLNAGATLHLTAQVAMANGATASGAIAGQIVFTDGATVIATVPLNVALTASLDLRALAVGVHTLTATYQGNTNYASSSGGVTESVVKTAASASLTSITNPTLAGKTAAFSVVVTSATGMPTGSVSLMDGTTVVGMATLNAQGVATFSTTTLSVGMHALTGVYNGDANYLATTSAPVTQTVNLAAAAVTLTGPSAPVNLTAAAAFTSVLTSPGIAPTGTLTLQEGATVIASQPVSGTGTFHFSSSTLSGGQHTLIVVYSGNAYNANAQSAPFVLTVQQAPTATTLTTSGSPAVVSTKVTLTATATSATPNLTGSMTFFDGATALATVPLANGAASFSTTGLAFGAHTVTATYSGDTNHAGSTSSALTQNMVQQPVVNVSSSLNPSNSGQTIIFTATIPAVNGVIPTGNVTFTGNGMATVAAPLDASGQARTQTSTLAVGTHAIVATYAGDTSFAGANAAVTQVVRNADTTTTLTVSADPVTFGTAQVFTATVLSNGGTATGTVSFTENGVAIGGSTLSTSGVGTLSLTTLAPGRHTIVANYLGDGKASASASAAVSVLVRQKTVLALSTAANPALSLATISLTATLTNAGSTAATGSIVFSEGATTLGTVALDSTGLARLDVPSMSIGTHSITATYAGDDGDYPAVAPILQQVVQLRSTVTTLTSAATNADDAQQVTLIAIVQSPTLATGTMPTGIVTYTTGTTTVGQATIDASGVATLSIRLQSSQTETLTATYSGDGAYSGSTSGKATVTSGPAAQFVLAISNPTIQMQSGQRTTINITVASVKGFNDMLKFGCVGLPYATTCTFSSTGMQLAANGSGTLQLVIDTGDPLGEGTGTSAHNTTPFSHGNGATLCLLPAAALLWCFRKRRWMPALAAVLLLCGATLGTTGCAGLQTNSTPAGTYTFQVTALGQGSGATQAQTITMTVAK